MDIVFFGSSGFGLKSLQALLDSGHNISCVVTRPDRKKGRGLRPAETPIKSFALQNKLEVYQPEQVNNSASTDFLKGFRSHLFVTAAYGQILSRELLSIPGLMPVNIHASLLPAYRGAAPINRAIINGETKTGITIIKMTEKMDAGPIIAQKEIPVDDQDNCIDIEKKLSELAKELIVECVDMLSCNRYRLIAQDAKKASFAPKLKKEDGAVDWRKNAKDIYNLVRGCAGWPGAFTRYKEKILKITESGYILSSDPLSGRRIPGQIASFSREGIIVVAGSGSLVIKRLQIEGKRQMSAAEFIAGHRIQTGEIIGVF